jgi:hypothetical protein
MNESILKYNPNSVQVTEYGTTAGLCEHSHEYSTYTKELRNVLSNYQLVNEIVYLVS